MTEPRIITRNRIMEAIWTLATNDDGSQIEAALTTHHFGAPHKCYTATLQRQTREKTNGFEVTSFWLFSGVRIMRRPCTRYNAREQEAFLRDWLPSTRGTCADGGIPDHPKLKTRFAFG